MSLLDLCWRWSIGTSSDSILAWSHAAGSRLLLVVLCFGWLGRTWFCCLAFVLTLRGLVLYCRLTFGCFWILVCHPYPCASSCAACSAAPQLVFLPSRSVHDWVFHLLWPFTTAPSSDLLIRACLPASMAPNIILSGRLPDCLPSIWALIRDSFDSLIMMHEWQMELFVGWPAEFEPGFELRKMVGLSCCRKSWCLWGLLVVFDSAFQILSFLGTCLLLVILCCDGWMVAFLSQASAQTLVVYQLHFLDTLPELAPEIFSVPSSDCNFAVKILHLYWHHHFQPLPQNYQKQSSQLLCYQEFWPKRTHGGFCQQPVLLFNV